MKGVKGFTLIELLVVISIIGLLSSVVLTSLTSARNRAKDAKLMQEARSLASLLSLEYAEKNSYSNFNRGTWRNNYTGGGGLLCTDAGNPFVSSASNFAGQATSLCVSMANTIGTSVTPNAVYNGVNSAYWEASQTWSIMVYLPGQNKYFCIGSSGRTSIEPATQGTLVIAAGTEGAKQVGSFPGTWWISPGCHANP